jgi:hypothetical protein
MVKSRKTRAVSIEKNIECRNLIVKRECVENLGDIDIDGKII